MMILSSYSLTWCHTGCMTIGWRRRALSNRLTRWTGRESWSSSPLRGRVLYAFWGNRGDKNHRKKVSDATGDARTGMKTRKEALLEYVLGLSPATHRISEYEEDNKQSSGPMLPKISRIAIRQTVSNLIGTLPPEYFEITISSREENLTQLMYSVLMTGYMFCNAHHRLELAKRLESASPRGGVYTPGDVVQKGFLPDVVEKKKKKNSLDDEDVEYIGEDVGVYAAGTQKVGIQGEVLRWHYEHGVQEIPAAEYIEQLEEEVAALRQELMKSKEEEAVPTTEDDMDTHLARLASYAQGQHTMMRPKGYQVEEDPTSVLAEELESELLAYLKTLSGEHVAELTECASADVMEAMNALVDRLIGRDDDGVWKSNKSECTSSELGEILFWLMSVGHQLRDMEIRLSLTTRLQSIPSFGPDDGADEYPRSDTTPKLPPGK